MKDMYHKWSYKVNIDEICIDEFTYRPADAKRITALLGFAGGMSEMTMLPPDIEDQPFAIEFSESGDLTLSSNERKNGVKLNFEDVDDLINLVNDLVNVSIDNHKLRPRPRGAVVNSLIPGDGDLV